MPVPATPLRLPAGRQRIAVPAYFDPDGRWDGLIQAAPTVDLVILNLESGPGEQADRSVADQVAATRRAGIRVVGYVDTGNGSRSVRTVHADVVRYFDWYAVDGIFFDQAHVPPDVLLSYYGGLAGDVRARWPGSTVVLNPGAAVAECVLSVADVVVDFEGMYREYLEREQPMWTRAHPAERFWHIVHDVATSAELRLVQQLSRLRGAGRLYTTDQTVQTRPPDVHLYDRLPRVDHWHELQQLVGPGDEPEGSRS